jgi:hypothetical protein
MSATRAATVGRDVSDDRKQARSGLSVTTLMIASASSLAAALVVSRLWGGGTLLGAAMTPVIVALVSEGLNRPARAVPRAVKTVRQTRGGRFDPVAEGRAGLREGDLERARNPIPAAAVAGRRVNRAPRRDGGGGGFSLRLPRPRVLAAIATGLVAFLIAGVFLTSSELVLGKSVTSSARRTTLVPVHRSTSTTKTNTTTTDTTPKTTTTPTIDTTTTPPAQSTPPPSETTPTVPPTPQTAPVSPQGTTAPPATPTPTPAVPQTTAPAAPPTTTP